MVYLLVFLLILIILAGVGIYFYHLASRIDRLNSRLEKNSILLETLLKNRQLIAKEISGQSPAEEKLSALIKESDKNLNYPIMDSEWQNNLSELLSKISTENLEAKLRDDLMLNFSRLEIAKIFYNNTVSDILEMRNYFFVRFFHLAGTADIPQYFNLNDY